jgi:hypothetical protein
MITKEQYAEWRHHPATKFFLQFLEDRKQQLTEFGMECWIKGNASFDAEGPVIRGRILELLEVETLTHEAIVNFYKEKDSGTEITEDSTR